jgi:hypothetical protein
MAAELKEPSALRTEVLEPLDAAVMRLLDRDVNRRYQSAAEVASDLAKLLPTPADDVRAVGSLVRSHLDARAPAVAKPARRPGSPRPITRVVPVVAAALAKGVRMGQYMGQLPGRLPGSIRKVTGLLPIIAARLPRRKTTTNPSVVAPGAARGGTPLADALAAPVWTVPEGLPRKMGVLAVQTLLAVTMIFVIGVGWRELRASAQQPASLQIGSDEGANRWVVIERLPAAAVVIPAVAPSGPAAAGKDGPPAGTAAARPRQLRRGALLRAGQLRARRAHARPKSGA